MNHAANNPSLPTPVASYWICSLPRSGSTLLCNLLESTHIAGRPREFFNVNNIPEFAGLWQVDADSPDAYLRGVLEHGTTPNNVFSVKLMNHARDKMIETMKAIRGFDDGASVPAFLDAVLPNLQYVYIIRRDKVRQAISLYKAMKTDVWSINKHQQKEINAKALEYNKRGIERQVKRLLEMESDWEGWFDEHGITPLKIVYEDFVDIPQEAVHNVIRYARIPINKPYRVGTPNLVKQADTLSEEWYRRYMAEPDVVTS